MVGMMMMAAPANSREKLSGLVDSANLATDIPSKLDRLRQLKRDLVEDDPAFLSQLLPRLFELQSDRFSPVRKFATEIIGEIGLKHVDFVPEIVPELMTVLNDSAPAVARQAITCGIDLFRRTLEKVAIQGLYSSELDGSLESSWEWMLKFREKLFSIAFQPGGGGVRLLALKFVEAVILLYTPDPNGSSEPPPSDEENLTEFNISWLRGGHPVLNVGDLSIEASQSLGLLLDQLRSPSGNSLSNSTLIVLINSLSTIAKKRPAFYGRILPVLLGLSPPSSVINGVHISGAHHALKNAFLTCLKCTHPGAAPWRDRLVGALLEMKAGGSAEPVLHHVSEINGGLGDVQEDIPLTKEEKPTVKAYDAMRNNLGKKRSGAQGKGDFAKDEDAPGKRIRATPSVSEESAKELDKNISLAQDDISSTGPIASVGDGDSGPVHQLVAMFGALVAQGEKVIGSLEILISSISADLLAELVMVNMRNLPSKHSINEVDDEPLLNLSVVGGDSKVKYPPSFVANVLSLSSTFAPIASLLDTHTRQAVSNDMMKPEGEEEHLADNTGLSASSDVSSEMGKGCLAIPCDIHDLGNLESEIPGLDSSACNDGSSRHLTASSLISTDLEDASLEQITSSSQRSPLNLPPSVSTDRSDELSPKATFSDVNSLISSTATSVGLSHNFVLPKMSAPVVNLTDDEKDNLQKSAFIRVIEAYKQIAVAGGLQIRSSLLANLGVGFPLELDPWTLIQKHILADYVNHEGHELTLRVLYRLFGEAEEDHDFFSSTTASSVYEMFLLTVVETLRDSFPPSDKSLSRLLGEVPYLPNKVLKLLECLCSPENSDKVEKELQSGDRVTQGLSTVWSLILLRPPFRDACLKIALKSAIHHMEEVRMKAIRLVANKLYPLSSIAQRIEDFAKETLLSVINVDASEKLDAEGPISALRKDSDSEMHLNEPQSVSANSKDVSSDTHQSCTSQGASSLSISEAQRCMSLYFALCTKKHSLFGQIFVIYKSASKTVKQAVDRHIPILVRTMGSSSDLLEIISNPPIGSENLLLQVLHTLTDGTIPSQELIFTIKKLYNSKLKDVEILIPILPFLSNDEVLLNFSQVVNLPPDKFQAALARIIQVTDACNACFEQRQTFTQQVLAKVLNQLVEQIPLPFLFMRTVLQAIGAFPALVDFVMEILSRLVSKQIWKYPKLWVGFLKCAFLTKPQSFSVLLQLPPAQLENALNRTPALKAPLVAHASQPDIRSSLPRSILVVLGIASDSQTSAPAQTSQSQTQAGETSATDKEVVKEKSKESSSAS
ncbi:Coatomer beta subunit [Parasponia andersonii]|uniref:Coatomer beta subunit n=1 Tax=Parasponia andersonii TaxID=3476 RepID=A0A2P5BQS6_PARAD|nr:Coatomer beta subunit [Parasponia andersonii]